jgi:tetratricopeptide (TPR) repeat protein
VQVVSFDKEYQALARISSEKKDYKNAIKYYKLAHEENPADIIYFYQVCFVADQFYKDPKVKLNYYEQLLEKYSGQRAYFIEFSQRRISELKEEMHFATD